MKFALAMQGRKKILRGTTLIRRRGQSLRHGYAVPPPFTQGRQSASPRNNGRTRACLPIDIPTPRPCSPAFSIPLSTNRGSLNRYLRVLFCSLSFTYPWYYTPIYLYLSRERIRMQSVKCKVQSDGIARRRYILISSALPIHSFCILHFAFCIQKRGRIASSFCS